MSIRKQVVLALLIASSFTAFSQENKQTAEQEAAYTKVITERADKIVATLGLSDTKKATKVRDIIANQYRSLNAIHTSRDEKVKQLKATLTDKASLDAEAKSVEDKAATQLQKLHTQYLTSLSKELSPEQVEKVKDGMTYGVVNVTYKGYVDMIPTLTQPQKDQIKSWLVEAREIAMDAESSDKKHWWFGKYKGKINNYLSAQGYDIKKEREEWNKRLKAAQENKS